MIWLLMHYEQLLKEQFLHQKVLNYRAVALGLCNLIINTPIETS